VALGDTVVRVRPRDAEDAVEGQVGGSRRLVGVDDGNLISLRPK
jgi:hypothetical protein